MTNEELYRLYVDSITPSIGPKDTLESLYDQFGIARDQNFLSTDVVRNHLWSQISTILSGREDLSFLDLRNIESQLILRHIMDGDPLEPYYSSLHLIIDATRDIKKLAPLHDEHAWKKAIQAAVDYNTLRYGFRTTYELRELRILNRRLFAVGEAAKQLRAIGYKVAIKDGKIDISQDELTRFSSEIEKRIREIGGINVAAWIFHVHSPWFDPYQRRYHFVRRVSQTGKEIEPSLPVGFLLNLCAKAGISGSFSPEGCSAKIADLRGLAMLFGTIYDVQPYNVFESEFKTAENIIEFLQEISLYDSLFSIVQMRPSDVPKFLQGVFDWVEPIGMEKKIGWTINDAVFFTEAIMEIAKDTQGPIQLNSEALTRVCSGITCKAMKSLFMTFAHSSSGSNQDFILPTSDPGPDCGFKPLLLDGESGFVILDASWCSLAFYEAIASALRDTGFPEVDNNIGLSAENFLRKELERHGISYSNGQYRLDKKDGECDCVIECNDTIIFIEVKKKSLTRKARAANDVNILLDLSASLIDAQLQLGRHELLLREHGRLELKTASGSKEILLNGRNIERIAVTVLDYGGFQDRTVLFQLLKICMGTRYSTIRTEHKKKFDELNDKLEELLKQHESLCKLDNRRSKDPFFNCWFLSIPKMLILLDGVTSNDSFRDELWCTRHMTTKSLDFYYDLANARKLRCTQRS